MEELLLKEKRNSVATSIGYSDVLFNIRTMKSAFKAYSAFSERSIKLNYYFSDYALRHANTWNNGKQYFVLIPDFNENTQMYRDFLEYKGYKDNWDEEGSNAMTKEVASNFTKVYYFLSKEAIESLVLSLDYNGTLLLETVNGNAGIEIGNKAYTFHVFDGNTLNGEEHVPFNAYKVASLANKFIEMNL